MSSSRKWMMLITAVIAMLGMVAMASTVAGETHTWDDESDLEGGNADALAWNDELEGLTLTGRYLFWKYRANPVLVKGTSGFDSTGVSEPCVVFAKGKYFLYYTGQDSTDYEIGVATSNDGVTFSKAGTNPVVKTSGSGFDKDAARDPFVIYEEGLFKMWYTGVNGGTEAIGYATSKDGVSWSKYGGGASAVLSRPSTGSWGRNDIGDPCVVKLDGRYLMYLSGDDGSSGSLVGMATSNDGISWTYNSLNPVISQAPSGQFGQNAIHDVAVTRDGPVFRMFFSGRNVALDPQRIGYAWSYDGYRWTRYKQIYIDTGNIFDNSSLESPGVAWVDGSLMMYYRGDDLDGAHGIGMAEMKPWLDKEKFPNSPILGTGSYDSVYLKDPCVIESLSAGLYHMYYGCYGSGGAYYHEIALCTSSDPTSWSSSNKNATPVLKRGALNQFDDERVTSPCVIKINGRLVMYYAGFDGTKWGIGIATGISGTDWTRYTGNPVLTNGSAGSWDDKNITDPWVVNVGGTYHMYYTGIGSAGTYLIGHATSSDGFTWTKDTANPVLQADISNPWETNYVQQPCVVHVNGEWTMYYSGSASITSNWRIGAAHSVDGVHWTRGQHNPVMDMGNNTTWHDEGLMIGSVMVRGAHRYFYYAGTNDTNAWKVGLAHITTDRACYTTPVLDASSQWPVEWGTLSWDATLPAGTYIRFQVATSNGGTWWNFVGPDGTEGTYFDTPGQSIFRYQSGKFMRVRAFVETDSADDFVPVLHSISVTYGPRSAPSPPSVTVTSPNGGEDWMKTKTYPVTWTASGNLNATSVELHYSTDNGTTWTSIASRQPNTGYYKWTVPSTETSGALIRVTVMDVDGGMAYDTSDATFAIDPPPPKAGAFLSPAEGAVLVPGPHEAQWVVHDPWGLAERPLTLEMSTDGGVTWSVLADGLSFTDGHTWDVPDLERSSAACMLRLTVLSWLGDISIIESGSFSIDVQAPTVTIEGFGTDLVEGEAIEVMALAEDDLGIVGMTLHLEGADGTVEHAMHQSDGGTWTYEYVPREGDTALWVTASDGAHETSSTRVALEVSRETSGSEASSSIAAVLALATLVAVVVVLLLIAVARIRFRSQ